MFFLSACKQLAEYFLAIVEYHMALLGKIKHLFLYLKDFAVEG